MAIRLTGLSSGMDTDAMVKEMTKVYQTRVDDARARRPKWNGKKRHGLP